jgi:integrase
LLESDRNRPGPPKRHRPELHQRANDLRAGGRTCEQIAEVLQTEFADGAGTISRFGVAALLRRGRPKSYASDAQPGLSPRTVRYIHTILHAALKDALRWNRVVRNVADAATPPSTTMAKAPQTKVWTAEQLRTFLQYSAESRYLPVWFGHQVTSVENRVAFKALSKTKRGHVIRLDTGTVAMLRAHRKTQNEERLLVGPGFVDHGLVFCRPDGSPYHPDRFSLEFKRKQSYLNRDNPANPVPELTLHGLRHTWATLALQAGIDIKIVSERLDHSSTHITREIYTHVTPPMQTDAAERVALLFQG